MDITWFGSTCCTLTDDDVTIVIDPFEAEIGGALPALSPNIVTLSQEARPERLSSAIQGAYKLIDRPGEYEIKDVFIVATAFHPPKDQQASDLSSRSLVCIYEMGNLKICHVGQLDHVPSQQEIEDLDNVDILLVPVGGGKMLNAAKASELIGLIQPSIVIPIGFAISNADTTLDPVDKFLQEMGQEHLNPLPKLRLQRSSLPEEMQFIVLDAAIEAIK